MSAIMQADGAAPTTNDIIERVERSLAGTPELPADDHMLTLERDYERLQRENAELRAAVKSQAPTVEMRVYGPTDHCAALLTGAWLLEQRGDKCAVAFKRDDEGHIAGLALSVEDL